MARPKPCAAPVTSAVRPLKSKFMIPVLACDPSCRHGLARRSRASQPWARRPVSISWISSTSRAVSGVGTPCWRPSSTTRPSCASTSVRRLRTARSRQMPLWVLAERRLKATSSSRELSAAASLMPGRKAVGSKPSKASGTTLRAAATARISRASAMNSRRWRSAGEAVGDRVVGQRGGEEHRAVGQLAPEIAPDVSGQHCALLELAQQLMQRLEARRLLAVDLADHDGAAAAVVDHARLHVVGAEIDEAAHGPASPTISAMVSSLSPFWAETT